MIIPFVYGGICVEPLVALEPYQLDSKYGGKSLRKLSLAAARVALQQEWFFQFEREEERYDQPLVRDVAVLCEFFNK